MDSDFAGDPVSRKSTTGLVAQICNHTCEIWIDASELDSIERWRSEILRSGEGRSMYQDLGTPMKIEIQSDSSIHRIDWEQDSERSTLTRCISGYKNESKMETSVSRRCLQRRTAQMLKRSQSLLQYYNNIASLQDWCYEMKVDEAYDGAGDGTAALENTHADRYEHRRLVYRPGIKKTETDSCQR